METFLQQLHEIFHSPWKVGVLVLYVIIIAIEWTLTARRNLKVYTAKDTATNVYFAILNGSIEALMNTTVLFFLGWFWNHSLLHLQGSQLSGAGPVFLYWFALFIIEDFFFYLLHYVDHHCRFFWAVHVTHHSSEQFNFSTGFRSSVFQPVYRMFYYAPIALIGFQPADILIMYFATQILGTFVHNDRCPKLGWLEYILVTPSHHRVHHGSNPKYLDKNMGMALIIWDRLFGTFQEEDPAEPVRYGLTKQVKSRDPLNIVFHEWKDLWHDMTHDARNWREKLGYIFHGPGWKPKREETK